MIKETEAIDLSDECGVRGAMALAADLKKGLLR